MNPLIQLKKQLHYFSSHWCSGDLGSCHNAGAVPPPDGGYPEQHHCGGKTPFRASTPAHQYSLGLFSLKSGTTGSFNTGIGAGALGAQHRGRKHGHWRCLALLTNTTGGSNTANGYQALFRTPPATQHGHRAGTLSDTTGSNTASGRRWLQ